MCTHRIKQEIACAVNKPSTGFKKKKEKRKVEREEHIDTNVNLLKVRSLYVRSNLRAFSHWTKQLGDAANLMLFCPTSEGTETVQQTPVEPTLHQFWWCEHQGFTNKNKLNDICSLFNCHDKNRCWKRTEICHLKCCTRLSAEATLSFNTNVLHLRPGERWWQLCRYLTKRLLVSRFNYGKYIFHSLWI